MAELEAASKSHASLLAAAAAAHAAELQRVQAERRAVGVATGERLSCQLLLAPLILAHNSHDY